MNCASPGCYEPGVVIIHSSFAEACNQFTGCKPLPAGRYCAEHARGAELFPAGACKADDDAARDERLAQLRGKVDRLTAADRRADPHGALADAQIAMIRLAREHGLR